MNPLLIKVFSIFLSVLCGSVFLYSAFTKLFPIEPFEYTLIDILSFNWGISLFAARIFIGFEFACGILLILNLWLKQFTLPIVSVTLGIFSIYLLFMLLQYGNTGDCGCFGQALPMSPLEGLAKNGLLLIGMGLIYRFHPHFTISYQKTIAFSIAVIALSLPFIMNPLTFSPPEEVRTQNVHTPINLNLLYQDSVNVAPNVELRKGKQVIAFMSLTCQHCKTAAKKLRIMKKRNPQLPIHFVLNGDKEAITPFFEATRADNVTWSLFIGAEKFLSLAAANLPQIYLVNESVIEKKCNYMTLEQKEIEDWLSE